MFSVFQATTVGTAIDFAEPSSMVEVGDGVLGVKIGRRTRTAAQTGSKGGGGATARTREMKDRHGSSAVGLVDLVNFERIRGRSDLLDASGVPYLPHIWTRFEGCRTTRMFELALWDPIGWRFSVRAMTGLSARSFGESVRVPL